MSPGEREEQWTVASIALLTALILVVWVQTLRATLGGVKDAFNDARGRRGAAEAEQQAQTASPNPWHVLLRIVTMDPSDGNLPPPPFSLFGAVFSSLFALIAVSVALSFLTSGVMMMRTMILNSAFPQTHDLSIDPLHVLMMAGVQHCWTMIVRAMAISVLASLTLAFLATMYMRRHLWNESFVRSNVLAIFMLQPASVLTVIAMDRIMPSILDP